MNEPYESQYNEPSASPPVSQFTLTKEKFQIVFEVAEELLLDPKLDIKQISRTAWRFSLRGTLLGEDVGRYSFRAPLNWWEAVKERWLPGWMRQKWPVLYRVEKLDLKVIYPDFLPAMPDRNHFQIFRKTPSVVREREQGNR